MAAMGKTKKINRAQTHSRCRMAWISIQRWNTEIAIPAMGEPSRLPPEKRLVKTEASMLGIVWNGPESKIRKPEARQAFKEVRRWTGKFPGKNVPWKLLAFQSILLEDIGRPFLGRRVRCRVFGG